MLERISVITDSTASLPQKLVKEQGIDVVPALITFGNDTYRDGIDIGMEKFMRMLVTAPALPTTGAPSLQEYYKIYQKHPGDILSIHLGSKFSAIFQSAQNAANETGRGHIHPIDSESVSLGIGFLAMRAIELIDQGATVDQIISELENMKSRTTVFAALDTLKYAHAGGRISHLEAQLGSLLQIKPILEIKNNQINSIEKPRTRGKSLSRLYELTEAIGPLERVGVVHADSPLDAQNIVEQIKRFHNGEIILGNIGPALATHGGPGIIGICAVKRK